MARKVEKTINEDVIKAQWQKQSEAHQRQWNAVVQIGNTLGLTFDEDGRQVNDESGKTTFPNIGQSSPDSEFIGAVVQEAVKQNMKDIVVKANVDADFFDKNNKQIIEIVSAKWEKMFGEFLAKQKMENSSADKVAVYKESKKPTPVKRFLLRLKQDFLSCYWKSFAYAIAVCCAFIAGTEIYYNHTLVSVAKEYMLVRTLLITDPNCRQHIQYVDTLMEVRGVNEMYNYVRQKRVNPENER